MTVVASSLYFTQMAFYSAIAATNLVPPFYLTPSEYENEVNQVFERYNAHANYVSYLVTGSQHCYYPFSLYSTADTTGTTGNGRGGQTLLSSWTSEFPVFPGGTVETECDGTLLFEPDWAGSEYCDAAQAGKIYVA